MIIKATSVYICHNTHKDKNHFMIHVADIIGTNLTQYIYWYSCLAPELICAKEYLK